MIHVRLVLLVTKKEKTMFTQNKAISTTVSWSVKTNNNSQTFPNAESAARQAILVGGTLCKTVVMEYPTYKKVGTYHENPYHVLSKEEADALRAVRYELIGRSSVTV